MPEQPEERRMDARQPPGPFDKIRVIDSAQLFADRREVQIRHRSELYRLLVTKNGKLILNK
jgi:hemin uptake protein HemP